MCQAFQCLLHPSEAPCAPYLELCPLNGPWNHLKTATRSARIAVVEQSNHVTSHLTIASLNEQDSSPNCSHKSAITCIIDTGQLLYYKILNSNAEKAKILESGEHKIKQVPSYWYLDTLFMDSNCWRFYYQAQKKLSLVKIMYQICNRALPYRGIYQITILINEFSY